jgi:phosphate starvation-inducible PhoH-like protein
LPESDKRRWSAGDQRQAMDLFGRQDENLRAMERALGVQIVSRGNEVQISGSPGNTERAVALLERLAGLSAGGHQLSPQDVQYAISLAKEGKDDRLDDVFGDVVTLTSRGRAIRPKTLGQRRYVEAMRRHALVFCIGPAGTGKTYLAMAQAVESFKKRAVSRIILTRPAVEAGEKLGFLPGDLQEKVDPYLRPLYDALWDILGVESFEKYMSRGLIEVAPLAYMRGRTLDDSFVILDEAQNTTPEQMKMFLTRLGFGSRAVVTGDITQVDLPPDRFSGLEEVRRILPGVEGLDFVYLDEADVVRHPLVQAIIKAYEAHEAGHDGRRGPARGPMAVPAAPGAVPAGSPDDPAGRPAQGGGGEGPPAPSSPAPPHEVGSRS